MIYYYYDYYYYYYYYYYILSLLLLLILLLLHYLLLLLLWTINYYCYPDCYDDGRHILRMISTVIHHRRIHTKNAQWQGPFSGGIHPVA